MIPKKIENWPLSIPLNYYSTPKIGISKLTLAGVELRTQKYS